MRLGASSAAFEPSGIRETLSLGWAHLQNGGDNNFLDYSDRALIQLWGSCEVIYKEETLGWWWRQRHRQASETEGTGKWQEELQMKRWKGSELAPPHSHHMLFALLIIAWPGPFSVKSFFFFFFFCESCFYHYGVCLITVRTRSIPRVQHSLWHIVNTSPVWNEKLGDWVDGKNWKQKTPSH